MFASLPFSCCVLLFVQFRSVITRRHLLYTVTHVEARENAHARALEQCQARLETPSFSHTYKLITLRHSCSRNVIIDEFCDSASTLVSLIKSTNARSRVTMRPYRKQEKDLVVSDTKKYTHCTATKALEKPADFTPVKSCSALMAANVSTRNILALSKFYGEKDITLRALSVSISARVPLGREPTYTACARVCS